MESRQYSKNTITKIFRNSSEILGKKPSLWRMDKNGNVIARSAYSNENSKFGWKINHIDGDQGNKDILNLEAIHLKDDE